MLQLSSRTGCLAESDRLAPYFDCRVCPDYDCLFQGGNGFFCLDMTLKGSSGNEPWLARLYCRKGRIGRFLINLSRFSDDNQVTLHGKVNVRCTDVIEWNHNGSRSMGLISDPGIILALNMFYSCHDFQKSLKKYLQTKCVHYIEPFIGNPFVVKETFIKNSLVAKIVKMPSGSGSDKGKNSSYAKAGSQETG